MLRRDTTGKIVGFGGFGNMNAYPARLVLQSVSDVAPKEVDFSKADEISKGQLTLFSGNGDLYNPLTVAQRSALSLGDNPGGLQAQKDVAVFGKPGEHNGVSIAYTATNEAAAKDEALGAHDSPDGVLYNCILNLNRLEGDAQVRAILHMGQHISDLRDPKTPNAIAPPFIMEYNAWMITTVSAVRGGLKFMTLPGGNLLWSNTWPAEKRNGMMDKALMDFLTNEEHLNK
jgi:hypothetical protein